jgi:hypothetical protein
MHFTLLLQGVSSVLLPLHRAFRSADNFHALTTQKLLNYEIEMSKRGSESVLKEVEFGLRILIFAGSSGIRMPPGRH